MHILHLLNGDATKNVFPTDRIDGEILVWREILAEGPVSATALWEVRKDWIVRNFGATAEGYEHDVLSVVKKLKDIAAFDELILWFEFDLVCQINLIYILSELHRQRSKTPIYLICPEKVAGVPNFRGLGELSSDQLADLYPSKVRLDQADLSFAAQAWHIYVENNPHKISELLTRDFGNLQLLSKALRAHLKRLPDPTTGLNHIQDVLLSIYHSGIRTKHEIYKVFWESEAIYGMGDLQLDLVWRGLEEKGLVESRGFV